MYDVIIVGSGVAGSACARELSRYKLKLCVVEKEEDVCCGTSKANSAIVHAGFDAAEGSLKAKLNVRGNQRMGKLAKELDIPFRRNGSLVLCLDKEDMPKLEALYQRGLANGVEELCILDRKQVLELEPNVTDSVYAALYAPTAGIICPFELNIALAEHAFTNGAEFRFHTEVMDIKRMEGGYTLYTSRDVLRTRYVVNAAGVYADRLHNMVSAHKLTIVPRRGEYCLLDKAAGSHVERTIFALPGRLGKGVLVTPTVHGNLLIGPNAVEIEDKEGIHTTREGLDEVMEKARQSVKDLPMGRMITSFSGLRAHTDQEDFIIGEVEDAKGFIDCAGIESPGIASSPAIGEMVAQLLKEKLGLEEKPDYITERKGILRPSSLSREDRQALIKKNPAYGNMICRCEGITEGEIVDAITRPLGARTLDGIKRRTRAGMGRCQSGFCMPRVMEILSREGGIAMTDITKSGGESRILAEPSDRGSGYGSI